MIAPVGEKLLFEHTTFSATKGGGGDHPYPPPLDPPLTCVYVGMYVVMYIIICRCKDYSLGMCVYRSMYLSSFCIFVLILFNTWLIFALSLLLLSLLSTN